MKTSKSNIKTSEERFRLEKEKYSLLQQKLNIGAASRLEVLESEKALTVSEEANISNKINTIISAINVFKAIRGIDYTNL